MPADDTTFDAIVIGSGISGGWAAKELCEKGLKTLVLERGRNVEHLKDYPTANLAPWELPHRGVMPRELAEANPIMSKIAGEDNAHFFVKDNEHPYVQERPFDWLRGYQVGGRSLVWGRGCQRWSKYEFTAPERQGYGINWPIGYEDIAPWYSHVERFIGVTGTRDGLEAMPDGEFQSPFEMTCVEKHLSDSIRTHYGDRYVVHGRFAHLTKPLEIHAQQGRGSCMARNLCMRGCPYGGYFSSNSSTLPWAEKTGNLTLRPHAVVHSILYDEAKGRATGVRVIDANTHAVTEYRARIIFANASALNTTLILLNSVSSRFPHGLGNDSGLLGKYVAFQNYRASGGGKFDGFEDRYHYGRRPSECIIPNFRNLGKQDMDFVGGYTTFTGASRGRGAATPERIGGAYKDAQAQVGPWEIYMYLQGETIPKEANHVRLHETQKDEWGIPLLVTSVGYDDNDERMIRDWRTQAAAMLEVAGCRDIKTVDNSWSPGRDIHEMGGCRMGSDPKTSLLNRWNQLHACPSYRFGQAIADHAKPLGVVPQPLLGAGPSRALVARDGKTPAILLFDDATVGTVLPKYAELLIDTFSADELVKGAYAAVAAVHDSDRVSPVPCSMSHYAPGYDPVCARKEAAPDTFSQFLARARFKMDGNGDVFPLVTGTAEAILHLSGLYGGDAPPMTRRMSPHRHVRELLNGQDAFASYEALVALIIERRGDLSSTDWEMAGQRLAVAAASAIANAQGTPFGVAEFMHWTKPAAQRDKALLARASNLFSYPLESPKVHIRLGSIHSVKGETHTATLVLDSFFHDHHLSQLKPWLLGARSGGKKGNKMEGSRMLGRLKLHYVAMTRPSHLLCLAMRRDSFDASELESLCKRGWHVVDCL